MKAIAIATPLDPKFPQRYQMTKPVLPPCSVRDCKRVADAVIKGMLLCGVHAVVEIEKLKGTRHKKG